MQMEAGVLGQPLLHVVVLKTVVIPRRGKPSQARRAEEHRKAFRRTVKWRTGAEGRISHLKRGYGLGHSRLKGHEGQQICTEWSILAYNADTLAVRHQ